MINFETYGWLLDRMTYASSITDLLKYFTGEVTTYINCLDPVQPGSTTQLACSISGSPTSEIMWKRPNNGSRQEVMRCNVTSAVCEPVGGVAGYSAVVDSPSRITITIESFNTIVDYGYWICRGEPSGEIHTCRKSLLGTL